VIPYSAKEKIFRYIDYDPHVGQELAHQSEARVVLVSGAERGGKSRFASAEATSRAVHINDRIDWTTEQVAEVRIAVCGQDYDETRPEMEYILEDLRGLDAIARHGESTPKQGKWEVQTITKAYIETVSLRDGAGELTGRGKPYDLVILAEAGRIRDLQGALLAARGRVAETRGRVVMAGTLWDDWGDYANLYRALEAKNVYEGERFEFPAWYNLHVYPGGEDDDEIQRLREILPEAEFARRVEAKLIPSPARIYPEFTADHIERIDWDPEGVVDVSIDPGYYPSKYAVLAIQPTIDEKGREAINVIDELWVNNCTHHDVIRECKKRKWWWRVRYIYGGHETKQHPSAESTAQVWRRVTGKPFRIIPREKQWTRINRVKTFLKDPGDESIRLLIDVKCAGLAEEFRTWKRKTDAKGQVRGDVPEDQNSDALDALGNYVLDRFGPAEPKYAQGRRGKIRVPARG
jgi:hypothetical protein